MVDEFAADNLQELLENGKGFEHLRVRKRGKSLILISGEGDQEQKHASFTWLGRNVWGLSMPKHTGRWEKTPFTGTLEELLDLLTSMFPMWLQRW